ncbi:tyrosinase family oxidase copper chaperone [Streptomyces sp. NPDC014995]|uniref:tyrosinase family oxidase copper chaperone n=1 Tax=Streptomyces sp. NPDC014995 TaxID=3364936 RepID=UPI0036FBF3FF
MRPAAPTTAPPAAADSAVGSARPAAKSPTAHPPGATARRRVLRGLLASASAVALAPSLVASGAAPRASGPAGKAPGPAGDDERFDETYRGHLIVGVRYDAERPVEDGPSAWHVTVDGRQLHLMRRADGSWMSMVDHYQSYATPLAAARAAVDELGPVARLGAPGDRSSRAEDSRTPSGARGTEREHRHGVHP